MSVDTQENEFNFDFEDDMIAEQQFNKSAAEEIERYRRMDEWIGSYHNLYSIAALQAKVRLVQAKIVGVNVMDFVQYTQEDTFDLLRVKAFGCVVEVGLLAHEPILKYFLFVMHSDPSPYIRTSLQKLLWEGLGAMAIGKGKDRSGGPAGDMDGLLLEGASIVEARQAQVARTETIVGAMTALKAEMEHVQVLNKGLWEAAR